MSNIKSLYREYFQKSRVFLYPALEIKQDAIMPLQTHTSWPAKGIRSRDKKLICLYLMDHKEVTTEADRKSRKRVFVKDKEAYKSFEKLKLLDNKLFEKFVHIGPNELPGQVSAPGNEQGVYIFNFTFYDRDWDMFLKGRYSKMSPYIKRKIKEFFRKSGNNYVYVESFLNPEKFWSIYSELLGVDEDTLKSVGELCTPPDFEKEALRLSIKSLSDIIKK